MDSLQTISQNTLEIIESCKLIEYSLLSYICITHLTSFIPMLTTSCLKSSRNLFSLAFGRYRKNYWPEMGSKMQVSNMSLTT